MIRIIVSFFILGFSLLALIFYILKSDLTLTMISQATKTAFTPQAKARLLLAKDKISAEFTANNDFLGMILVRIHTFNRRNQDFVTFRLKEKGQRNWYYENTYDALHFYEDKYYPFGFPIIENSNSKIYIVEIESLYGSKEDGIAISSNQPAIIAKYQYPKNKIIESKTNLIGFFLKKVFSVVEVNYLLFVSLIYILPFIYYLFFPFDLPLLAFFSILMIFDIFFIPQVVDSTLAVLVILASLIFLRKKKISFIFIAAFFFYFLGLIFTIAGNTIITEKTSAYGLLFVIAGIIAYLVSENIIIIKALISAATRLLPKILLIAAFALTTCLQIHNSLKFVPSRGFDYPDHLSYIDLMRKGGGVPLANQGVEYYQPPLYYAFAALSSLLNLLPFSGFVLWVMFTATAFFFFKKKFSPFMASIGTIVASCLPVVLYMSQTISNEFFSVSMISLTMVFYLFTKDEPKTRNKIVLGVLLGLSLLSKATAFVLLAALILDALRDAKFNLKVFLKNNLWVYVPVLLIAAWFYIRNIVFFRNPFVTSVDFPKYHISQPPGYRDIKFFTNITSFIKMDLFHAHFDSFFAGTYFSWFYDGHNVIIPVQSFSKAGILLVLFSLPLLFFSIIGFIREIRKINSDNFLLLAYPILLFISYILYNLKLPFYSTVKAAFIMSLVVPFGYFFLKGIESYKKHVYVISVYVLLYILIIFKNFWILPFWYK